MGWILTNIELMKVKVLVAFVLLPLMVFSSCASTKEAKVVNGDASELYSAGVTHYQDGQYEDAASCFKGIMEDHPLSSYSVESQLMLADVYYAIGRYDDAASYYTTFATLHPTHHRAPYSFFQKGMSYIKELPTIDRDQTTTRKALFAFEDFLKIYPDSPFSEKAENMVVFLKRRLAESEFYVGKFYYKAKDYRGAIARFGVILKDYTDVGLADKALYYIGKCYSGLGEDELARDAFSTLVTKFPESPFARVASDRLIGG